MPRLVFSHVKRIRLTLLRVKETEEMVMFPPNLSFHFPLSMPVSQLSVPCQPQIDKIGLGGKMALGDGAEMGLDR